ncbi:MAG TPA: AbrB/MazE/SpoVT family DNA-binding domain-containing protein, partial [Thermoprotei archaeon]|nr:AbrB/MazE/SpoVT family DNA-binding domain-containing protein [Thermoprotei archaeon]
MAMTEKYMLRRVQLTGGSTLIVSLPKEWVKSVHLKPGDYVVVMVQPDNS